MTYPKRARGGAVSNKIDHAPTERGGDVAMLVLLALVFGPIVAMHVAFTFGAEPAAAAPAAMERMHEAR